MAIDPVGILGAILILAAWIIETKKIIGSKKLDGIDIRFLVIYLAGSLLLTYYSVRINDMVFVTLSGIISFLTLLEIVFVLIRKF